MFRKITALAALVALLLTLCGCNFSLKDEVEGKDAPTLPGFHFRSELICQIDRFENGKCVATVQEDSGAYDKDTVVIISYESVVDDLSPTAGDYITFKYVYTTDVTALDGTPHITIEELTILPEYTPPETTAATEETTVTTEETTAATEETTVANQETTEATN